MREVDADMADNREFSNLPRKYKISVSGCCIHCAQPDINCVARLWPEARRQRRRRARLRNHDRRRPQLRAEARANDSPYFLKPEQVWPVVHAVSSIFRDHGYRLKRNRARFKFLVGDWWDAGGKENGGANTSQRRSRSGSASSSSGTANFPVIKDQETDHIGDSQAEAGRSLLGRHLLPRRAHAQRRARQNRRARCEILRAGPGRDPPDEQAEPADHQRSRGESRTRSRPSWTRSASIIAPSNFRKGCVSCTGIEFCNLAVAETKNRMIVLVEQLETHERLVQGQDPHPLQRLPELVRPASDRRHRLPRREDQGQRRNGRCLRRLHRRPARPEPPLQ